MVFVNELLPDPIGKDADGEWIELSNSGEAPISVSGWKIKASGKGNYVLKGSIGAGEELLLKRTTTKLTLKNEGDTIYLYDGKNNLIDKVSYEFKVAEGQSLVRYGGELMPGRPTPGEENVLAAQLIETTYNSGEYLNGDKDIWGGGVGLAILLALGILFVIKRNEDLSNIFFGRDEKAGRKTGF